MNPELKLLKKEKQKNESFSRLSPEEQEIIKLFRKSKRKAEIIRRLKDGA